MTALHDINVKVADQVWIALALLTSENPTRDGFTGSEIRERVRHEFGSVPPGVVTHIAQHCVATKPVSPGRNRMITKRGSLNALYREGDPCHPDRLGGKAFPKRQELPHRYHELLAWYQNSYTNQMKTFSPNAALLHYVAGEGSGIGDIAARHDEYLAAPERVQPYEERTSLSYQAYAAEDPRPYRSSSEEQQEAQ